MVVQAQHDPYHRRVAGDLLLSEIFSGCHHADLPLLLPIGGRFAAWIDTGLTSIAATHGHVQHSQRKEHPAHMDRSSGSTSMRWAAAPSVRGGQQDHLRVVNAARGRAITPGIVRDAGMLRVTGAASIRCGRAPSHEVQMLSAARRAASMRRQCRACAVCCSARSRQAVLMQGKSWPRGQPTAMEAVLTDPHLTTVMDAAILE